MPGFESVQVRQKTGRYVVAVWIVLLYALFTSAVLFTLSVYHFQREVESTYLSEFQDDSEPDSVFREHQCDVSSLNGLELEAWSLLYLPCVPLSLGADNAQQPEPNLLVRLENEIGGYELEKQQTDAQLALYVREWAFLKNRATTGADSVGEAESDQSPEIITRLIEYEKASETLAAIKSELEVVEDGERDAVEARLATAESALSVLVPVVEKDRAYIARWLRDRADQDMELQIVRANFFMAERRLNFLETKIAGTEGVVKNFRQIHKKDGDFYNRLFSIFVPDSLIENIWELPTIFISMVLILSMGGLGSMITVTIEFLGDDEGRRNRMSPYFFRPMLGTIVALAAYIGIKSGHVSLAGEGVAELSPFLLSFIGVIAGLMSEHVYRQLVVAGERVMGGVNHEA